MEDPLGRPTVKDFLQDTPQRLFPVGRLDWDSEGLLLLTNDGDYAHKITHPSGEITKTYLVKLDGQPTTQHFEKLRRGVSIVGGKVKALYVNRMEKGEDKYAWVKIIITEGKNRQIRLMFEKIGFDVLKLQRTAIGNLKIGALARGKMLFLNDVAAEQVFKAAPEMREREIVKTKTSDEFQAKNLAVKPNAKLFAPKRKRPGIKGLKRSPKSLALEKSFREEK
jgi:23S rRNA pseudouridine2605 synthase